MEKDNVKELIKECIAPFIEAENMLLRAEAYVLKEDIESNGKSYIRNTLERFEKNLQQAWDSAYKKYGVTHCYDLPRDVYKNIVDEFIKFPLSDIILDFHGRAAKHNYKYKSIHENPYILAIAAIRRSYNWS